MTSVLSGGGSVPFSEKMLAGKEDEAVDSAGLLGRRIHAADAFRFTSGRRCVTMVLAARRFLLRSWRRRTCIPLLGHHRGVGEAQMRVSPKFLIRIMFAGLLLSMAAFFVVPIVSMHLPDYRDIKDVIADADTILVREVHLERGGGIVGGKVLFEVREPEEVQEVLNMMSFRTEGWRLPCHCTGYPVLEWKKGDVCRAITTFKHTSCMHWVGAGDCSLDWDSGDQLGAWLVSNGVDPKNDPRQGNAEKANSPPATHGRKAEASSE